MSSTRVQYNLLNFNCKWQSKNLFWSLPAQAAVTTQIYMFSRVRLRGALVLGPALCRGPAFGPGVTYQLFWGAVPHDLRVRGSQRMPSGKNVSV